MAKPSVCIVGAGIAGLVLGRCLLRRGIPAVIYEKARAGPRHSYGITLQASSYQPLLKVLNVDESVFKRAVAIGGEVGLDESAQQTRVRVNRAALEDFLRDGLDIKWNHTFSDTTGEDSASEKTIHFENGKKAYGNVIVGADGIHSRLRQQGCPNAKPKILPFVVFNGKRTLKKTDSEFECFDQCLSSTEGVEYRSGSVLLRISANERSDDGASISYTYSRPATDNDALHKPNRPNAGAKDIPEEIFDEIGCLGQLPEPFARVFEVDAIRKDRLLHWLMRSILVDLPDLQEAAKAGFVLIGEATAAQPILGSWGANSAIADGMQLASFLFTDGMTDLGGFYDSRYPSWQDDVAASEARLQQMHAAEKPRM